MRLLALEFSNISNTLFDQKSPALLVPVVDRGHLHFYMDITNSRLNRPRGRFSENLQLVGAHCMLRYLAF